MNPYEEIAFRHLSIKQLEVIIAKKKAKGSPEETTQAQKDMYWRKKKMGLI